MTLRELLRAKDEAAERADVCTRALEEAREMLAEAEKDCAEATDALLAAHAAISERLKERGHHSLRDDAGADTVYHYAEPTEDNPHGWKSYQPIPGDA